MMDLIWTLHEEGHHEDQYEGLTTTNKEDYNENAHVWGYVGFEGVSFMLPIIDKWIPLN